MSPSLESTSTRQHMRPSRETSTASLIPPNAQFSQRPTSISSFNSVANLDHAYQIAGTVRSTPSAASLAKLNAFTLSPDPSQWGSRVAMHETEPDDDLHNPDPGRDRHTDLRWGMITKRGLANIGCLAILLAAIMTLFAGYPIISYVRSHSQSTNGGFNLGGVNASGQIPEMTGNFGLIDNDTPDDVKTKSGYTYGETYELVFSDEFNQDGRTFYPGDDPYWEAVDLHYWVTNNMEWYDPEAITTADGSLVITMSKKETHNLDYQGGMLSTWNKFCFTGGIFEASVSLPGYNNILGLWPAVWAMGNLGRAGYGATLDGMWPYTYDACDVGTVENQTVNGEPYAATVNGDKDYGDVLSYLPGQRLSRCTCDGEIHPGPKHSDGTYVGRSAPEIDVFEAQISDDVGYVSQSAQWAPFNEAYVWKNTSDNFIIYDESVSSLNSYIGGRYQQATSVVSKTDQNCYTNETGCFSVYAFEYKPGFDDGYITWVNNGAAAWTIKAAGMGADDAVEISARPVPQEPMYLIANLGMSTNFGYVDEDHLPFPTSMYIDWIRVYQRSDSINIGCDPDDFPTASYIEKFSEAYNNPNLTTWVDDYGQTMPKNSFLGEC
ncbi:glycoside hydrolase family 16 protein [Schizophyllum commune Tattone D]|nr:glycoside hydrolase family 16 protein [Schizophyllum commune Tattone D]